MYLITGLIVKPGGSPVKWQRMSKEKMTKAQCEKLLSIRKEAGKSYDISVVIEHFNCERSPEAGEAPTGP